MKKEIFVTLWLGLFFFPLKAQEILLLWENNMPNSKGVYRENTFERERAIQIGDPFIQVFEPSKAERTGTSVLIIPGGGYVRLAYEISGIALAKWYNTIGITAFVLYHRFPQSPDVIESYKAPLQDAQRAIRYIRANADRYGIDKCRVGVMGSSAGAHLAASLSVIEKDWSLVGDSLDKFDFKPSFAILISPVISMTMNGIVHRGSRNNLLGKWKGDESITDLFSLERQVNVNTPPTLLFHAADDTSVSPLNSIVYYDALLKSGVMKSSLHIFSNGKHSISLRKQPGSTRMWPIITEEWLIENKFYSLCNW